MPFRGCFGCLAARADSADSANVDACGRAQNAVESSCAAPSRASSAWPPLVCSVPNVYAATAVDAAGVRSQGGIEQHGAPMSAALAENPSDSEPTQPAADLLCDVQNLRLVSDAGEKQKHNLPCFGPGHAHTRAAERPSLNLKRDTQVGPRDRK